MPVTRHRMFPRVPGAPILLASLMALAGALPSSAGAAALLRSATLDPASPHYADQSPLFARGELKPVWLDESEIRAHLSREYQPGE